MRHGVVGGSGRGFNDTVGPFDTDEVHRSLEALALCVCVCVCVYICLCEGETERENGRRLITRIVIEQSSRTNHYY